MGLDAFLLVITGALLHALWNLAAKQAAGGVAFVWLYGVVSMVVALPFGIAAWIAHPAQVDLVALAAVCASSVVHIVYSLTLQKGYQESDFSIVYPVARGSGPLFAVIGAILVLGEMPSARGWCGIAAILIGIGLLCWRPGSSFADPRTARGLWWGGITGVCIALYTVVDGWAVKSVGIAPELYFFLGLALRMLMLMPQVLRHPAALRLEWQRHRWQVLCVGVLSPLAYTLILYAITIAPLSYVAPMRELSMLIGVFLGARWLREVFTPWRGVGTLAMVVGVVLIVAS